MGKETQFSRPEVEPVVEKTPSPLWPEVKTILPNNPSAAIELDLMKCRHDDDAPK